MKYIMILVACAMLIGCSGPGNPVPTEAVKACVDVGGTPFYYSGTFTKFECRNIKEK